MTIATTGPISIQTLRNEFGSGAASLSQYYRGAGIVVNNSANAGVPTSGAINLHEFYGAASTVFSLSSSPPSFSASFDSRVTPRNFSVTFVPVPSFNTGAVTGTWARLSVSGVASGSSISGNNLTLTGSWGLNANREYSEVWRFSGTDSVGNAAVVDVVLDVSVNSDA